MRSSDPASAGANVGGRVDGNSERRLRTLLVVVLLTIVVSGTVDLILDAPESWRSGHVLYEVLLIVGALAMAAVVWRGWLRTARSLAQTRRALDERQTERDAWRASAERALLGFGAAIDQELQRWGLTPAEREVALQLLKGQSHKEIAYATGRSERTVRQHAVAVYQKSGLRGRAELAAFFLEDLILPAGVTQAGAERPSDHRAEGDRVESARVR